jgi:Xaa-Pro aminopeptidase
MKHQEVFDIVTGARDAVVEAVQQAWREEVTIQGWQLDRAARDFITGRGYGEFFAHRTGHSMGVSPTAHALGVNLDDLETHDTRAILPGVGFSVEPGIYLPEFGVRSEIDMYVDPDEGPVVTTSIQREIIRVL